MQHRPCPYFVFNRSWNAGDRTPGCNLVRRLPVVLTLSSHVCLCTYYNSHVPSALAKRGFHGGPCWRRPLPSIVHATEMGFHGTLIHLPLKPFRASLKAGCLLSFPRFSTFLCSFTFNLSLAKRPVAALNFNLNQQLWCRTVLTFRYRIKKSSTQTHRAVMTQSPSIFNPFSPRLWFHI